MCPVCVHSCSCFGSSSKPEEPRDVLVAVSFKGNDAKSDSKQHRTGAVPKGQHPKWGTQLPMMKVRRGGTPTGSDSLHNRGS